MYALQMLIVDALEIYKWILIVAVIFSWLAQFNLINTGNRFVYILGDALYKVTEPALRPIRNVLPNFGGIDFSPVILILLIVFVQRLVLYGI